MVHLNLKQIIEDKAMSTIFLFDCKIDMDYVEQCIVSDENYIKSICGNDSFKRQRLINHYNKLLTTHTKTYKRKL